ncbi:MAG: hypothetical protein COA58_02980 [Bacteroidetes bacterium]|nr:MAG: hypothetical protein COA58_02980 [Bacteroidota bacterium]
MRPKEFNRNSVLEKCITLFWEEGYNGTGIQKVVTTTGVNRYSLYEEFGNKEGILLASLELYKERYVPLIKLTKSSTIQEAFYQFYSSFFYPSKLNGHPLGCYISTMAMELRETTEIQLFFNTYLVFLEQKFSQLLEENSNLSTGDLVTILKQLIMYYCTSMGMYIIFPIKETEKYLQDNIKLITKCLKE